MEKLNFNTDSIDEIIDIEDDMFNEIDEDEFVDEDADDYEYDSDEYDMDFDKEYGE